MDPETDQLAERAAEILARWPRPRDAIASLIFTWACAAGPDDRGSCLALADHIIATVHVYRAVGLDEPSAR